MSTREQRAFNTKRKILTISMKVRQKDGSFKKQFVDVDVRKDKRRQKYARRRREYLDGFLDMHLS